MDCSKCIQTCKAQCCGVVPFPKEFFEKHIPARLITEPKLIDNYVIATDSDNYCCYLTYDFKCKIYEERPEVCRKFGDESHLLTTCQFQNKDGNVRTRSERRRIKAIQNKYINKTLKKHNE